MADYHTKRKIKRFLNKFDGQDTIVLYAENNRMFPVSDYGYNTIEETVDNALELNEYTMKDIYFIPNYGGMKVRDITYINACYIDIDAGRDESGSYFKTHKVNSLKRKMIKKINGFSISPNMIVETRNGYQIYWLLERSVTSKVNINNWNVVQRRLCNHFADVGSDPKVLKLNQIMRLPFTTWYKSHEGKEQFVTSVTYKSNKTYNLSDMDRLTQDLDNNEPKRNKTWKPSYKKFSTPQYRTYKSPVNQDIKATNDSTDKYGLLKEVIAFLGDSNKFFYKNDMMFMAKNATELSNRLRQEFNLPY